MGDLLRKRIVWAIRAYCASCKEGWYMVRCRSKKEAKALAEKFSAYSKARYSELVKAACIKVEEVFYTVEPLPKGKKAKFDIRKYDTNDFMYGRIEFVHIFRGFASPVIKIPDTQYSIEFDAMIDAQVAAMTDEQFFIESNVQRKELGLPLFSSIEECLKA